MCYHIDDLFIKNNMAEGEKQYEWETALNNGLLMDNNRGEITTLEAELQRLLNLHSSGKLTKSFVEEVYQEILRSADPPKQSQRSPGEIKAVMAKQFVVSLALSLAMEGASLESLPD